MKIKIDPEIRALIPPQTTEERAQLEANLIADGCRDAVIVWKEEGIIIDGHHREALCTKLGIGFRTIEKSFASRDDVLIWVIRNQFGRRNLNDFQRADLALKLEPLTAQKAKDNQRGGQAGTLLKPNLAEANTRTEVAKSAGISHGTLDSVKHIKRDAEPEIQALASEGKISISAASLVSDLPAGQQKKIAEQGPAAVKAKAAKIRKAKATVAPEPTKATPEEPWADFNSETTTIIKEVRALASKVQKVLGLTADGGRTVKWNHFMIHAGTVGQILEVAKTIESNLPAKLSDKQPGFIPVRQLELSKSISRK